MIRLISYANKNMTISLEKCIKSAYKNGVNVCYEHSFDEWEEDVFYLSNKSVLDAERGSGYWLWKPYLILETMLKHCDDGDILIYSDAGVEFVNSVHEIINRMDEDIFFFTNGWPHVEWCKMDVINAIIPFGIKADGNERNIKQIQASVIFFKVNQKTRDFVKEWLLYSQMPGFIDDSPSKKPNYPTFAEHRHDQAILTCVAIKHGYTIDHWWPTQYSNHLPRIGRDSYPVIFNHHRKRNNEY